MRANPEEALFYVDRIVDLLFISDLFLSFVRPFLDEASGKTISHIPSIIRNYLKFWFYLDAMSCVPYDMIDWGIATDWGALSMADSMQEEAGNGVSALATAKILRLVRLLRLLKMLRLLRTSRITEVSTCMYAASFRDCSRCCVWP